MPEIEPTPESSWIRQEDGDRTLEENWLFRLRRERYRSRTSGRAHDYYVIHLADSVNVVALTPDERLILVRQFRAGSGRDSLETPAACSIRARMCSPPAPVSCSKRPDTRATRPSC